MDEIDAAQDREEIGLADSIRNARRAGPVIAATGRCLLCEEPVSEHQRWCDEACHSRYMKEKYRKCVISFSIPGPPVAKGRARATMIAGRARMYTPAKTASYEGKVAYLAKQAMGLSEPVTGPVALTLHAVFAYPASWSKKRIAANLIKPEWVIKKPDGDNCLKIISDALNGVCFKDDCQVALAKVTKVYGDTPGVAVTVEALS